MARTGIGYEQVEQAADALVAAGRVGPDGYPTLAAIREHLGTGSPNTIHAHLRTWKGRRPAPESLVAELPSGLTRMISDVLDRTAAAARAESEARLIAAQAEAVELARAGTAIEAELNDLQAAHEVLKAEHAQLAGSHAELQKEVSRLQALVDQERRGAESARVDLAQCRLKSESHAELVEQLRGEQGHLRAAVDAERAGRIESERALASATASAHELRNALERMTHAHDQGAREREQLQARLEAEHTKTAAAERELAACRAESKALAARAEDLGRREERLQAELTELRGVEPREPRSPPVPNEPGHGPVKPGQKPSK